MKKKKIPKWIIFIILIIIITFVTIIYDFKRVTGLMKPINNERAKIDYSYDEDYKTKSEIAKEEKTIIETTEINTSSLVLIKLNNSNWNRMNAQLVTGYEKDEKGNYIYSDGFTLICNNITVNNVIFNSNYKDSIISNIKVGDSFETIKSQLGIPTFENKELGMLGYKTKELYVFFYNDYISVYPNQNINNLNFEKLLTQYYTGQLKNGQVGFLVKIRNDFPDFEITQNGDDIIVKSINRKIEIVLNDGKIKQVNIYNDYKKNGYLDEFLKNEEFNVLENDLAERVELERIQK